MYRIVVSPWYVREVEADHAAAGARNPALYYYDERGTLESTE
jgi:hypothetical protein